jgi:NCS1 family nucleobase:cation symporter-1
VRVADIGNFSRADGFAGGDRIGAFVLMTTIVASFVLGWAPYGADYTRYLAKTASGLKIYGYTVAGLTVAAGWLQILGLGVAEIVTGNSVETIRDDVLGGGALGAIAMVAIFLGIISVNVMNDYTGSLSLIAAGVRIPRPISAVIVGGAAFALVLWLNSADFAEKFVNYLLLISYWVAAFAGVVLTDWWLRKKRADVTGLLNLTALPIRTNAIIAFVAGVGASVPFMSTSLYVGPVASDVLHYADVGYYVGFLVAGSVYWTLSRFLGERLAVRLAASSSP